MNIPCKVNIANTLCQQNRTQPAKSVITLNKNTGLVDFHITSAKTPEVRTPYNISCRNISAVHSRMMREGKISITFKSPPHLMMISDASPKHIELLLKTIKNPQHFLDLKLEPARLNIVSKPKADVKSMTITSQKQYPPFTGVGFPKTLINLTITGLNYRHFDTRICALDLLTNLDLSHNKLKKLPPRLWDMQSLVKVDLSHNDITELPVGMHADSTVCKNLQYFDISHNKLGCYPEFLRHCTSLNTLKLTGNSISIVPNHIKSSATTLRHLDLSSCNLKNLPAALTDCCLNELQLSGNPFPTPLRDSSAIYKERFRPTTPSLQECCVKSIIRHGLRPEADQLPECLLNYVRSAQNCKACFKLVLESALVYYYPANLKSFAASFSRLAHPVVITGFVCSEKCFKTLCPGKVVVPARLYFQRP